MLYLDTSVVVSALMRESQSVRVHEWLLAQQSDELAISDWTLTYFASALAVKKRSRQLSELERVRAATSFDVLVKEMVDVVPLLRKDFEDAARWIRSTSRKIRAGDALHLAVAMRHSAILCTLDRDLCEAARDIGVAVDRIVG